MTREEADCVSRKQVLSVKMHVPIALCSDKCVHYGDAIFVRDVEKLPSITPQKPVLDKYKGTLKQESKK